MGTDAKVLILMGSDSDLRVLREASGFLEQMAVAYEMRVSSAHRSPERTRTLVIEAERSGVQVFVCAAGMAAHLAGAVAALTTRPVIGVPVDASPFGGMDALLSTVQMPPGIPVATVAVGKPGARNAAILACQILALSDPDLAQRLRGLRAEMARGVEERDAALQKEIGPA
ncbi:MAG: 5-(carboxyamino)imidazole ribonucleotide mutase [Deltaproteobacteria bacterium]|nr:5-(carboxyamino)imidazole ribonucleotide mutase [Deltaproteobacteria bacterium]